MKHFFGERKRVIERLEGCRMNSVSNDDQTMKEKSQANEKRFNFNSDGEQLKSTSTLKYIEDPINNFDSSNYLSLEFAN